MERFAIPGPSSFSVPGHAKCPGFAWVSCMPPKPNRVVGLDIGTSSIRVVVAEIGEGGRVDVVGLGASPSRGLRKGVVINIEATVESIAKAVQQAETMAGCRISSV